MSVKDQFVVCPHVMLNACLALGRISRSDSETELLNSGWDPVSESAHTGGSKDVQGASGSIPEGAALLGPVTIPELYQR